VTRTSNVTYDPKGRFIITKTNALGQTNSQNTTFDAKWGKPLTETTINNLTTIYEYDGYGRAKKVTVPEGYSVTTAYLWDVKTGNGSNTADVDNSIYYTYTQHPGRPDTKTWYDVVGRERKTTKEGWNNKEIWSVITYDALGRPKTKTLPFFAGEAATLTTIAYNNYGLPATETNSIGTTTYSYNFDPNLLYKMSLSTYLTTTVQNPMGQVMKSVTDGAGKAISSTDNKGILTETDYDSWGNPVRSAVAGVALVNMSYDAYGRQTNLIDKNAGETTYTYNSFGELVKQVSPKGTHTMEYDLLGRVKKRTGTEGTTNYTYVTSGDGINQVASIIGFAGEIKSFTYDKFGRTLTETDVIDATTFTNTYVYDLYSNLTKVTYPSTIAIDREYDANGYLKTIKTGATTIFENIGINALGQYRTYKLGSNQYVFKTFNEYGAPTNFRAGTNATNFDNIQNLSFDFELKTGNLTSRTDTRKGKVEYFKYDALNRLETAQVGNIGQAVTALSGIKYTFTFADNGNITSKTDVGTYDYDPKKIHAIAGIINPVAQVPTLGQAITYSPYHQPLTIVENNYTLTYTYSADYQRIKGILTQNGIENNKRYYFGDFERDITSGVSRDIHYIGADGLNCIIEKVGTATNIYYTYQDYLGSLLAVTNATGTVVMEQNFDAWGRNRNTTDWTYNNIAAPTLTWLTRGYTGHEHLPVFGLINMNGRLYDPLLGRMLSPDNYTHGGSQGYNRYTYAMNNPLKYTDPDGQNPILIAGGIALGGLANVYMQVQLGNIHNGWDLAKAFGVGAVATAAAIWTGGATAAAAGLGTTGIASGLVSGAIGSGFASVVQGMGNFAFFNTSYSPRDLAKGIIIGGISGGILGGLFAWARGENLWWGNTVRTSPMAAIRDFLQKTDYLSGNSSSTGNRFHWEEWNTFDENSVTVHAAKRFGGDNYVSSMDVVREIYHGEKIQDLITLAQDRTFSTGVEHAIVKLGPNSIAPGARVLVSGGPHGISFAPDEISLLFGHTHPYVTGASRGDFQALIILNQSKQYIFEGFNKIPLIIRKP
jgi:RHS repeat-associated protein